MQPSKLVVSKGAAHRLEQFLSWSHHRGFFFVYSHDRKAARSADGSRDRGLFVNSSRRNAGISGALSCQTPTSAPEASFVVV